MPGAVTSFAFNKSVLGRMDFKMNKLTTLALAAVLTLSSTAVFAGSLDSLSSASTVSITTVESASDNILLSAGGRVMERVDLGSLRARVSQNPAIAAQLAAYGVGADDVIGITGSTSSDVTLYVRG